MDWDSLVAVAWQAREMAYAPYSNFHVGAAVLATDGRIFSGCNVENISFGLTNCAERVAMVLRWPRVLGIFSPSQWWRTRRSRFLPAVLVVR